MWLPTRSVVTVCKSQWPVYMYCMMTGGGDTDFRVEEPTLLLSSCPIVSLWAWEGGVAMLPHPHPPGLLLLWLPSQPLQVILPYQPTATVHLYSPPPPSHSS